MPAKHTSIDLIGRREALERVGRLFGGVALVGQARLLEAGLGAASVSAVLSEADIALVDEVAETMLPETSTPGARAAGVGPFIALMVADAYDPDEQRVFREGLSSLDRVCRDTHGRDFLEATPAERLQLLERLDREQFDAMQGRADGEPVHYFRMMKELALLGYFTSEIGCTQAQRFAETPGRYEPCIPYAPGDKAWARHA